MTSITQEDLREFLSYDPDTGVFTRIKVSGGKSAVGTIAGTPHIRGYVAICVKGRKFLAHRLAWLYVFGVWPSRGLDHINRNKADNRISNLREASQSENMQNKGMSKSKANPGLPIGITMNGVSYMVRVGCNGVRRYVGSFKTLREAVDARIEAKEEIHKFHPNQI